MQADWKSTSPPTDKPFMAVVRNQEFKKGFSGPLADVDRIAVVEWSGRNKGFILTLSEATEYDQETYTVLRWDDLPAIDMECV